MTRRSGVLLVIAAIPLAVVLWLDPIRIGDGFHRYADRRTLLGIPNALDVVSNLPFLIVGALGLTRGRLFLVFAGVLLVGLGSANYHRAPSDDTLLFDFIPINIMFMALCAALIADRLGRGLDVALIAIGIAGALAWYATDDLRWHALVQVEGAAVVTALLALFPRGRLANRWLWAALGAYLAARAASSLDGEIFRATGAISGHSLKHLLAALGTWFIYRSQQDTPSPGTTLQPEPPSKKYE